LLKVVITSIYEEMLAFVSFNTRKKVRDISSESKTLLLGLGRKHPLSMGKGRKKEENSCFFLPEKCGM
jgi:hypothetical protein